MAKRHVGTPRAHDARVKVIGPLGPQSYLLVKRLDSITLPINVYLDGHEAVLTRSERPDLPLVGVYSRGIKSPELNDDIWITFREQEKFVKKLRRAA